MKIPLLFPGDPLESPQRPLEVPRPQFDKLTTVPLGQITHFSRHSDKAFWIQDKDKDCDKR